MSVLWRFSLPAFLSGTMVSPVRWIANAMLVAQAGGYAELGIFMAATQFRNILELIGSRIGIALLPILASQEASRSDKLARANMLLSWSIGVAAAVPLVALPEVIGLFGEQFAGVSAQRTLLLVLCFTSVIMYKHGLARVITAEGMMWWAFLSNAVWATLLLSSFWFLRPFGAIGLAGAYLVAYVVNTICFVPLYSRIRLIPPGTLMSRETLGIWLILASQTALAWWRVSIYIRLLALFAAIVLLTWAFHRLLRGRGTLRISSTVEHG